MSNSFICYFRRFFLFAIISILLTFFAVSIYRISYVHRRLSQASKYFVAGMPDRVARELSLAYVWSPAYTALRSPVQYLYRDAVTKSAQEHRHSTLLPRSFHAPLPVMEKFLIPFDFVVDLLYVKLVPVQALPSSVSGGESVTGSHFTSLTVPAGPHPERRDQAVHSLEERMQSENIRAGHDQAEAPGLVSGTDTVLQTDLPEEPAGSESDRMWGVVTSYNAPLYNQSGVKTRNVPAGSLVDVARLQDVSSGGQVILGTVWSSEGTFKNVILRRNDADIYRGRALSSTSLEQRELVSRRAEIIASIEFREKEIAEAAAKRNPHHQDYRKVLIEYKAIGDEAEKLKSEFDAAEGPRRMEVANRLRVLKNDQQQLMPRYRDLKAKKEAWENRSGGLLQNSGSDDDPDLLRLRRQLMELDARINNR